MTHRNSERTDPSHSTEVQALSQAPIVSVTAKSQEQGSGMSEGHKKRHRRQKLLGEFFGGREKRRRTKDPVSSPAAIMQKVVKSKEKGSEGHLIGVVYAWRSMNSCLLMR